jgi:hypothetical protein
VSASAILEDDEGATIVKVVDDKNIAHDRPVATMAGMIPLALGLGAGSQMLQPLAIAVIGGILASMVLSLVITPAVHYFLAD